MTSGSDLRLVGMGASPYTRKLRAALRYRRIPYRFVVVGICSATDQGAATSPATAR